MSERSGTFLVTAADEDTAVLRDVDSGQVHPLASNPGLATGEVLDGTVRAEPPLEVTWRLAETETRRRIEIVRTETPPSDRATVVAADLEEGDLARLASRTGDGETHVIAVAPERTEAVMAEVADDEGTLSRAARLGATRVEIRGADGVVTVRYRAD